MNLIDLFVEPWAAAANCHGYEHLMIPEKASPASPAVRRALRRCAMCPVRGACLRWGLTEEFQLAIPVLVGARAEVVVNTHRMFDSEAIFGGTTHDDREAVAGLDLLDQEERLTTGFRARALGRSPLCTGSEWIETAPLVFEEAG